MVGGVEVFYWPNDESSFMGPPGLQFTFLARPVSFNTKAPHDVRDEEEPGGMLPDWTHPCTVGGP